MLPPRQQCRHAKGSSLLKILPGNNFSGRELHRAKSQEPCRFWGCIVAVPFVNTRFTSGNIFVFKHNLTGPCTFPCCLGPHMCPFLFILRIAHFNCHAIVSCRLVAWRLSVTYIGALLQPYDSKCVGVNVHQHWQSLVCLSVKFIEDTISIRDTILRGGGRTSSWY